MKINDNDNQRKSNEHQWKSNENLWNSRLLIHSTTHILHILSHIITYYHILPHFSTDYHILTNMVAYYYIFPPITTYFHILQHSHRLSALPVQCRDRFFFNGEGVPENWGAGHEVHWALVKDIPQKSGGSPWKLGLGSRGKCFGICLYLQAENLRILGRGSRGVGARVTRCSKHKH